jgi:hypothetical protein
MWTAWKWTRTSLMLIATGLFVCSFVCVCADGTGSRSVEDLEMRLHIAKTRLAREEAMAQANPVVPDSPQRKALTRAAVVLVLTLWWYFTFGPAGARARVRESGARSDRPLSPMRLYGTVLFLVAVPAGIVFLLLY